MKLRSDFDFLSWIGENEVYKQQKPSLVAMAQFAKNVTLNNVESVEAGITDSQIENFLGHMLQFFNIKERVDGYHEPEQRITALNDLKYQLLKLSMVHDTQLESHHKLMLEANLPSDYSSFTDLINDLRKGV